MYSSLNFTLKALRAPLIEALKFATICERPVKLNDDAIKDIHRWLTINSDIKRGFPIQAPLDFGSPVECVTFTSDAAGGQVIQTPSGRQIVAYQDPGVGIIGHTAQDKVFYVAACTWPKDFITRDIDLTCKMFTHKTTFLESFGLLTAFCHTAPQLRGAHVKLRCDNFGVYWAIRQGRSRKDCYTSMIVRAIIVIAGTLPCKLHPCHCPRLSDGSAIIADTLTRNDVKGTTLKRAYGTSLISQWPKPLEDWLKNPVLDWDLGWKILKYLNL